MLHHQKLILLLVSLVMMMQKLIAFDAWSIFYERSKQFLKKKILFCRFLIGSPKSRNTSNEEKFYRCPKPNFRSQTPSCTPIRSPIESNDLSGLTISAQNQQDLLVSRLSHNHKVSTSLKCFKISFQVECL